MKGFTKWLVKHRIAVIILCIALMIPSVLGMAATKTKYDLLYYLPQDLETVHGQEILLQDFGKGAFSLLVTEGMSISEQADMENALKLLGRDVALVEIAGENHHVLDYNKKIKWLGAQMAWFQKWLKDDPTWWDALFPKKHL